MDYPYLLGVTTHGSSLGTLHTVLRSRHELVAISIGSTYKGYEKKLQIKVGRYFLGLPACQTSQPLSGYVQIWEPSPLTYVLGVIGSCIVLSIKHAVAR